MSKAWGALLITGLLLALSACGGLRYVETAPEAKDFRPRGIVVLPAEARTFPEAKGPVDRLFAEALTETGWFERVVGGEAVERRVAADEPFRQAVTEYLTKLDKLSFSDPAASGRIGSLAGAEAILRVRVDYWNYTTEKDDKVGKVGLSLWLIEAKSGRFLWRASHARASEYLLLKPELPDVARSLIREMVGQMPH